jgi:mono/diheme cytochrome c family protein
MRRATLLFCLIASGAGWLSSLTIVTGQGRPAPSLLRSHPAISYQRVTGDDPVARLDQRLERGEVTLKSDGPSGYLTAVLEALGVPVVSQVLVFSKTSFQAPRINPKNPRAIYFNDTVAVGWVRGGDVLEFVAHDPRQGNVFYTLSQTAAGPPRFQRNDGCVSCHTSDATQNVPGWFIGSVFPGMDGTTQYGPAYTTDHRSPFDVRWGGWYVTGTHAAERHMGNALVEDAGNLAAMVKPETVHVTSLAGRFDMNGYLSPHSDLVALLVLEHQAHMGNLITRIGWEARVGKDAGRPLREAAEELVDYLLFLNEAPLPGPIAGTSGFATSFAAAGPRDSHGRSLRDLDLRGRLMKYPCSYMIYSEPFAALPEAAREAIYLRMWEILSGKETAPDYASITAADRQAILEILRETKPDLPRYYFGESPSKNETIVPAETSAE